MARFANFKDWKTGKSSAVSEEKIKNEEVSPVNSELLALIEDLEKKRNEASRANDGLGRQIHDLDIRIAKLEMQKNEMLAKKKELEDAKVLSEKRKRVPRTNHE
jgi:TolA-binding protein